MNSVSDTPEVPQEVIGSASLFLDDYWWYRVRADLLEAVFRPYIPVGSLALDVGSADAPSSRWLDEVSKKVAMDLDPRGLDIEAGDVVGSITRIPFNDGHFDVVGAFDVVEHVADELQALDEVFRSLKPGGLFLMAVPAYEWAWTSHDEVNRHFRRYTKKRAVRALKRSGFEIVRTTYGFAGVFPFFAVERLARQLKDRKGQQVELDQNDLPELPNLAKWQERLLYFASRIDKKLIGTRDLPFGSSLFVVARKPESSSASQSMS